jgi:hypothetical protein
MNDNEFGTITDSCFQLNIGTLVWLWREIRTMWTISFRTVDFEDQELNISLNEFIDIFDKYVRFPTSKNFKKFVDCFVEKDNNKEILSYVLARITVFPVGYKVVVIKNPGEKFYKIGITAASDLLKQNPSVIFTSEFQQ